MSYSSCIYLGGRSLFEAARGSTPRSKHRFEHLRQEVTDIWILDFEHATRGGHVSTGDFGHFVPPATLCVCFAFTTNTSVPIVRQYLLLDNNKGCVYGSSGEILKHAPYYPGNVDAFIHSLSFLGPKFLHGTIKLNFPKVQDEL